MADLEELAGRLDDAAVTATATDQLGEALTLDDAYRVQSLLLDRRYGRGERRIGVKLGFTSRAKMVQMGVDELIWGRLTDAMLVEEGGVLDPARFVHPRVEPEVCFLLGAPLSGTTTALEAMHAVSGIAAALEVIDSRYRDFRFSLPAVVADNCSSAGLVIGSWKDPASVDLANLGLVLSIDGIPRQIGSTAAILGNPVRSLVRAARLVAEVGERLDAGDIVMAGGATAAEELAPGMAVRLEMEALGRVGFVVGSAV